MEGQFIFHSPKAASKIVHSIPMRHPYPRIIQPMAAQYTVCDSKYNITNCTFANNTNAIYTDLDGDEVN